MRKLKVAVVRENLLAVVGGKDAIKAMILNQLLYWHEHVTQKDQHLLELIEAYQEAGDHKAAKALEAGLTNGWFWKSAKKLAEELMFVDRSTVTKKLKELEKEGFISSRPGERPDLPKHYKVNIGFLKKKLWELGYTLDGFVEDQPANDPVTESHREQMIPCDEITTPVTRSHPPVMKSQPPVISSQPPVTKSQLSRLQQIDSNKDSNRDYIEQQQEGTNPVVVVETIQHVWKETFDEEIDQAKVHLLLKDAGQDEVKVLEAIKKVATNMQPETPIKAVRYELRTGWDFDQQSKKQTKLISKLPKALQIEQPKGTTLSEEERAERRARIQAKLKRCDESLSARFGDPFAVNLLHSQK